MLQNVMPYVLSVDNLLLPLLGLNRRLEFIHALHGIRLPLLFQERLIELYPIAIPDMPLEPASLQ